MRIILYTGKGGVGKTTLSAATAVCCARRGHRTIVISTDAAHSLADCFGCRVGPGLTEVEPNLWAEEVSVNREISRHWGVIHEFLTDFLSRQGFERVLAEELAVFPGMEDLFCLLKIKDHHDQQRSDVVIVDCAPTGSTIRMLSFPDMIRWYMKRLFHIERRVVQVVRPVVERMSDLILPDGKVFDAFEKLFVRAGAMKDLLCDTRTTSCRLVANAEKMVIAESQRAYTYMSLFGYMVDAVFVNKLLPTHLSDPYFDHWKKVQQAQMAAARERFDPLPLFPILLMDREIVGADMLATMATHVFGDRDPTTFFYRERVSEFRPTGDGYELTLRLPLTSRGDVEMWVAGDELTVEVGGVRRNVVLPRAVAALQPRDARIVDQHLQVTFGGRDNGSS